MWAIPRQRLDKQLSFRSNGYASQCCEPLDKLSPSRYAKKLLQGDQASQGEHSEISNKE
jgi:hypothetical protein